MTPSRLFFSFLRTLFYSGVLMAGLCLVAGSLLVFHVSKDLPKLPSPLSRIIETPQSLVYAADGRVMISLGERKAVTLDMVSPDFINAIVAIEDHRFFEHHGINKLRILKGLYVTLFTPGRVQGASTITQQLAKNLFFSFEKTWQRKFKEMLVAFQIEAANSKEEILEAYINQIHFGAGAQGVEKAAQTFFGKGAGELSLSEAALLAGLPKSPTHYNPFLHYEKALARRRVVLDRMAASGFISQEVAEQTAQARPELHAGRTDTRSGSYFLDALIQELVGEYGEDVVFHGGIRVYATLDPRLQDAAETAVRQGLNRLDDLMGTTEKPQAALVAVENASGAVTAMVGGRDYYTSEFNRAVNGRRQAGSGFKPFLYYAAFETTGLHPASVVTDRPVSIPVKGAKDWAPENFERVYRGPMVLKQALTDSVNTIAAQLVEKIGPKAVVDVARACGVKSPLSEVYSVALGTSGVTVTDMAAGFSTFANLGVYHPPFLFWRVEDARGRVIFERIVRDRPVLNPSVAYQVVDMMKAVVDSGSGRSIRSMGFHRPAAGKTGTSNDYNDAWFTGFTPSLCVSVWTGFDREQKLRDKNGRGITGGRGAAPIWTDFMIQAMKGEPERDFRVPEDIGFHRVDVTTGCPEASSPDLGNNDDPTSFDAPSRVTIALKRGQRLCPKEEDEPRP